MKREKLTLRLDRDLIEKAKRVARERDTSVSGMVAGFSTASKGRVPRAGGTARSRTGYAALSNPKRVNRWQIERTTSGTWKRSMGERPL